MKSAPSPKCVFCIRNDQYWSQKFITVPITQLRCIWAMQGQTERLLLYSHNMAKLCILYKEILYPSSTLYSLIIYQMKALFLLYQMVYKKIANGCSLLVFFRWYGYLVGILKINCTKTTVVARRGSYGPTSISFNLKALSKLYKMVLLRGHLFVGKTLH
jgi:hypothetical protein